MSGGSLANEPEPMQFADFALWQRQTITSGVWDHQLDYWRKELAGCPPPPQLPSDRRLGRHRNFEGSQIRHPIPEDALDRTTPGLLSRRRDTICLDTSSLSFVHPPLHRRGRFLHWHGLCQSPGPAISQNAGHGDQHASHPRTF